MKKDILVKELEYPKILGEGNEISKFSSEIEYNGCAVITKLVKDGKLEVGFDWGNEDVFPVQKIISKLNKKQLSICENSPLCGEIIKKIKKKQYEYYTDNEKNNICVTCENERYVPNEGKHRACIVKNFMNENDTISVNLIQ